MRLGWSGFCGRPYEKVPPCSASTKMATRCRNYRSILLQHANRQRVLWVWQRAAEVAYQQHLMQLLSRSQSLPAANPLLQAVFCIDVRSERLRRALERQHPAIETRGFAGFWFADSLHASGFSDESAPIAGAARAPLELRPPAGRADVALSTRNQARWGAAWESPAASLGLVESLGLTKVVSLVRKTRWPAKAVLNPLRGRRPTNQSCGVMDDRSRWKKS